MSRPPFVRPASTRSSAPSGRSSTARGPRWAILVSTSWRGEPFASASAGASTCANVAVPAVATATESVAGSHGTPTLRRVGHFLALAEPARARRADAGLANATVEGAEADAAAADEDLHGAEQDAGKERAGGEDAGDHRVDGVALAQQLLGGDLDLGRRCDRGP